MSKTTLVRAVSSLGAAKGANPVLACGPNGAYTLHRIEFPGCVETVPSDPNRLIVKIRMAALAERYSLSGGCSFPAQSGAIFTVTVTNALSQPVQFTSPVLMTVQFKSRPDPTQTDVVRFDSRLGLAAYMRLARDTEVGDSVSFAFTNTPGQSVNTAQGTVTVSNFVGLTGTDGCGTFGAVALDAATPAMRWSSYR